MTVNSPTKEIMSQNIDHDNVAASEAIPGSDLNETPVDMIAEPVLNENTSEPIIDAREDTPSLDYNVEQSIISVTPLSQKSEDFLSEYNSLNDDPEMMLEKEMNSALYITMNHFKDILVVDGAEGEEDGFDTANPILNSPLLAPLDRDLYYLEAENCLDTDTLDLAVGMPVSRSESVKSLTESTQISFEVDVNGLTEYPRPSTPEKDIISSSNALSTSETSLSEKEILLGTKRQADRQSLIQKVLMNLERKEMLSAKNGALQNKLSEHFKKKRVKIKLILDWGE